MPRASSSPSAAQLPARGDHVDGGHLLVDRDDRGRHPHDAGAAATRVWLARAADASCKPRRSRRTVHRQHRDRCGSRSLRHAASRRRDLWLADHGDVCVVLERGTSTGTGSSVVLPGGLGAGCSVIPPILMVAAFPPRSIYRRLVFLQRGNGRDGRNYTAGSFDPIALNRFTPRIMSRSPQRLD